MNRFLSLFAVLHALSMSSGFGELLQPRLLRFCSITMSPSYRRTLLRPFFAPRFCADLMIAPVSSRAASPSRTVLFAEDGGKTVERGVSVDQDGKSNVWAIEPKMELSTKSSDEKTKAALIAGGGLAAFAAMAGAVLTNLPDPNQF